MFLDTGKFKVKVLINLALRTEPRLDCIFVFIILYPYIVERRERDNSSYNEIKFMRANFYDLINSQKPYLQMPSHLGVYINICICGGTKMVLTIA